MAAPTTLAEIEDQNHKWLAARLLTAVYDVNRESRKRDRMSLEVKGLADTIRNAKAAIGKASDAAARLGKSADSLTGTLAQVDALTSELDNANADLQGAVGTLTNGGPALT